MKCIYTGNFTENHKKKRRLMGSAKEKALIDVIEKRVAPSVYIRSEANRVMIEGMYLNVLFLGT